MEVLNTIQNYGILPELCLHGTDEPVKTAAALKQGGLPLVAVKLHHKGAADAINAITAADPDILVGAGDVISCDQIKESAAVGAKFIMSPGFSADFGKCCADLDVQYIPGCTTPMEILKGWEGGFKVFNFLPAQEAGGARYFKQAIKAFPGAKFICSGGIGMREIEEYLKIWEVAAVGGNFMAPRPMRDAQDYAAITDLCGKAVDAALGFSLAHIGINGANPDEGMQIAEWFKDRFGWPIFEGVKSHFSASAIECCNGGFPGQTGHIAVFTLSPERAVAYFNRHNIGLREEFKNVAPDGRLIAVYLKDEIGGLAVHVVKKP